MINSKKYPDFIKTMYEQHWLNYRQGVIERLQLTSIYSVIFVGSLVITDESLFEQTRLPLIGFLMLLSVFAVLYTLKVDSVLHARQKAAEKIEELYGLSHLHDQYNSHWVNKRVKIGRIFPIYFSLWFCFLLFILLYIYFPLNNQGTLVLIPFAIFVVAIIGILNLGYCQK